MKIERFSSRILGSQVFAKLEAAKNKFSGAALIFKYDFNQDMSLGNDVSWSKFRLLYELDRNIRKSDIFEIKKID